MDSWFSRYWQPDVAIDCGTALTRVASERILLPPVPSCCGTQPALRAGVICDAATAAAVLAPLLAQLRAIGASRLRALACVPSDANPGERQALLAALRRAGASQAALVPEVLAAAIGAGLDISLPQAQLLVDVGAGVTDCAVIRSGEIIASRAVRIGCTDLLHQLQTTTLPTAQSNRHARYLLRRHGVATAPNLDLAALPSQRRLEPLLATILASLDTLLAELPEKTACEVLESGLVLTGGGSLLPGMRARFAVATGLQVSIAPAPLDAVVRGARAMLPVARQLRLWDNDN